MRTPEQLIADTAPFPASVVEKLKATEKRPELAYVPWQQYAQRLLLHHPGHSWRVTSVTFANSMWVVAGELDLSEVQRTEVGNVAVEGRNVYAGVGEDSTPTAAESNAYKRAAAHAGIGLHLYGGYWLHGRLVKGKDNGD